MDQSPTQPETVHQSVRFEDGLTLDCGRHLASLTVAYRSYGTLNAERSNAVLICHALTGDQYVAEVHPLTGKPGWWETVVGPGKAVDTDRYFVICANVLGGCMGSTGPRTPHDERPFEPWGTEFPAVTIQDMVRAQKRLVDHLGISRLFAVIGGSMGGMQALAWAALYPETVFAAVPVAAAAYHSAQNIAFHEIGRQAIAADPFFYGGRYWAEGAYYLCVGGRFDPQIRTAIAERDRADAAGRPLRSGKLPRISGLQLRAAVRRQFLFDHHPGDGSVRPGGRVWRGAGGGFPGHQDAVFAGVVFIRLAVSDGAVAGDRAGAQPCRGECEFRRDHVR
jgi:pimeloyl-ACP methyl ester carboxylesterase